MLGMKRRDSWFAMVVAGSAFVAGCGPLGGDRDIAVVDLVAVAKATGQDKVMAEQVAAARRDLATQLARIAGDLEQQLQAEQTRLGGAVAASREREFQQLTAQARQQLAETQALAQQKAQDYQAGIAANYRREIEPVIAELARSRGAAVVLAADARMMWFDGTVDITDEVIAELRSSPVAVQAPGAGVPPDAAPEQGSRDQPSDANETN